MSQRTVELFIGRLLTDEELRVGFLRAPRETLTRFRADGWDLTDSEIEALVQTESRFWSSAAERIPSRLQRCSLRNK